MEPKFDLSKKTREPIVIYVAPRKRLKRDIDRYAVELGNLAINWNNLHDALVHIFARLLTSPDQKDAIAYYVWHSTPSDLAQRKMLRAAIDATRKMDPTLKTELLWLLGKIDGFLANRRNDAIHSPFIPANAETQWVLIPLGGNANPRAKNLHGKDLLKEFKWYVDYTRALYSHAHQLLAVLKGTRALPDRPALPHQGQRRSRKAKPRKSSGKARQRPRGPFPA